MMHLSIQGLVKRAPESLIISQLVLAEVLQTKIDRIGGSATATTKVNRFSESTVEGRIDFSTRLSPLHTRCYGRIIIGLVQKEGSIVIMLHATSQY